MKKWLNRIIPPAVTLVVVGIVVMIIVGYFRFISVQVRTDSERHLKEVYGQVTRSFQSFIDSNWGFLESCKEYYAAVSSDENPDDPAQMRPFIEAQKKYWNFTEFFFLDENRNYYAFGADQRSGTPLKNAPDSMIHNKAPIMMGEEINGTEVTMFAVAADGVYKGFPFSAVSVSYTNSDLAASLDADAFEEDGESLAECYVIRPDGSVLLSTEKGGGSMRNYFDYLDGMLDGMEIAKIKEDLNRLAEEKNDDKRESYGYLQCKIMGEDRCLIYMPIDYEYADYFLLGDVPQTAVSQGFLLAQRATMRVLLIIFSLILAALLIILALRIIRQSKRSKKELQYRERMFDVLSNNVNDIFLMLDPQTQKVDYISPNIERLLGISVKVARSNIRAMAACAVDYNIVVPDEELRAIRIGENKSWECEYMHQATGERRWYRVMIYHMSIQGMEKYVIVMSDRTLDKQLNQKLQEALDAAKSANEAKSNFLSNMSHDIRTPMNAIVGFSVLLERNASEPELVREYTRKIMASSHHLLSLINDVLDMSKIESGKTSLNLERFSLPDLLEEINIIITPQAKAKAQEFCIHTQGMPPNDLMGDRLRLNQILFNLLSNAVKYTPTEGKIDFTVQELPEPSPQFTKLRFIVKDTGIGMSEEFIQEIFQPFSREKNSVVNKIQGTGLGMAITKSLVDLMGGIIRVESAPGKGSTFTVELSFSRVEEETQDAWFRQKITRMLVADDEEEICLNIREMMHDTGVDVGYVTDGRAAVDAAVHAHERHSDFDVILLDWKMPQMDGVETARAIREKIGSDVPILVLTSYDWSDIEAEARQAGINAFMPKPFFTSTFFQTIKPLFFPTETEPQSAPSGVMDGKLFLVAEDNELNAEILTEMLLIEGAKCELAQNGKAALELFENSEPGRYDLILMDVQMPIMNGYEATRAIRALPRPDAKSIPIVAMTANTFAEDVKNALDAGMNAHLAKPIDMDAVKKTVARLLEKHDSSGGETK